MSSAKAKRPKGVKGTVISLSPESLGEATSAPKSRPMWIVKTRNNGKKLMRSSPIPKRLTPLLTRSSVRGSVFPYMKTMEKIGKPTRVGMNISLDK